MMDKENLIKRYLNALNNSDLKAIIDLFEEDAIVYSPLYNEMSADFFIKIYFKIQQNQKQN